MRLATLADLEALLALEAYFPGDRISRQGFRHLLSKGHAEVWLLEREGRVWGDAVVLYRRGFDSARLYSLVVHSDARGEGLGGRLLSRVEEAALHKGCVSLRLEVREDNAARGLYERRGYHMVGRTADYYEDASAAIRMRRALVPEGPKLLPIPYYPQSLEFTCGPAALMMALRFLGFGGEPTRELELNLWREATTVFMMAGHGGCSAHGLALAALRRGFRATILSRDSSVPFLDTVRSSEKREVVALSHESFLREVAALGGETRFGDFGLEEVRAGLERGEVPLVLMSAYRLYGERIPHWLVVTGLDSTHLYLHDPFVPEGFERADGLNLPLPRGAFGRVSRFGRARHRYMVLIGSPASDSPAK